ncbi:hypothetical protein ACO0K3_06635 [Undibacterium sp. Rencai35W]|uniref:hypothetical protein n=1 Tax=Undibacterium sp. Rencai35W TaxID=3413046 RepID=UPI003BF0B8B0
MHFSFSFSAPRPVSILGMIVAIAIQTGNAVADDAQWTGQVRGLVSAQSDSMNSPLTLAGQLTPGLIPASVNTAALETELHLSNHHLSVIATVQGRIDDIAHTNTSASSIWVNELVSSIDQGAWQFSAGKKIVGWDVAYGFRPNDVVQQEKRRSLISTTVIGRPLLMAEYFNADTAVSFVWVNPLRSHDTISNSADIAEEQAFATRLYYRAGSLDLHAFTRLGQHTRGSVGAAAAWVATEALELHASLRYLQRSPVSTIETENSLIQHSSPWSSGVKKHAGQALLGGTWTSEDQHSFLLEAWWDGTALSGQQWRAWTRKNQQLRNSVNTLPQLSHEIAYNLAWQSQPLSTSANLRRNNVFARWSWQTSTWQPAIDLLWTPEDGGRITTASLGWQGDQWRIDGGFRQYGGPSTAVLAQLPARQTAYASASWSF